MRKSFCDRCGKEITTDVEWVFNHELCPECAKAVDIFITHPSLYETRANDDDYSEDYCISSPPFAWDNSDIGW